MCHLWKLLELIGIFTQYRSLNWPHLKIDFPRYFYRKLTTIVGKPQNKKVNSEHIVFFWRYEIHDIFDIFLSKESTQRMQHCEMLLNKQSRMKRYEIKSPKMCFMFKKFHIRWCGGGGWGCSHWLLPYLQVNMNMIFFSHKKIRIYRDIDLLKIYLTCFLF